MLFTIDMNSTSNSDELSTEYAGLGTVELAGTPQSGDGFFTLHGIALGEGDITYGGSQTWKKWTADALRDAAETLEGKPLVRDHTNSTEGKIGHVSESLYVPGVGVVYEAKIAPHYDELIQDIKAGLMEVSVKAYHKSESELETDEEAGALIVDDAHFVNLSVVNQGAAPSNTAQAGGLSEADIGTDVAEASAVSRVESASGTMQVATLQRGVELTDAVHSDAYDTLYEELSMDVEDTPSDGRPYASAPARDDVYETESEAMERARELGCDDVHTHTVTEDGSETTYYMPCSSMESYTEHEDDEEAMDGAPEGLHMADGTMYAVGPDEHDDDSTEHADDAKYPLTSCTGDNSIEDAWRMRGLGDFNIEQSTLEERIRRAASAMDCDMDIVGMDDEENMSCIQSGMRFFSNVNSSMLEITDVSGNIATVTNVSEEGTWKEPVDDVLEHVSNGRWRSAGNEMIRPGMKFFSTVNNSMVEITSVDEDIATIQSADGEAMWKEPVNTLIDKLADGTWEHAHGHLSADSELSEHDYSQGDWVRWDTRNSTEIGKVAGSYTAGDDLPDFRGSRGYDPEDNEVLYALRMYKERDGSYHPIEGKPIGHYESSIRSADAPENVSDSSVELSQPVAETLSPSMTGEYSIREGQWVQWYPDGTESSSKHGKVTETWDADDDDEYETYMTIQPYEPSDDPNEDKWSPSGDSVEKPEADVAPWGNYPSQSAIEEMHTGAELADDDARQEDAPQDDQKEGSDKNDEGSADSTPADIDFSDEVEKGLKNKVEQHNEEHGDEEGKRVTLKKLKAVYRRGAGAYSDSHREGMTRNQWSMARVNAFLYLVRNGQPENDAYTQDNDLLPDGHPRAGSEENASASMDELDTVYSEWDDHVNMTASELEEWSEHPCATEASVDPKAVIERNTRLLETDKSDWDEDDIADAKRTVSFISRMSDEENEPEDAREGPHGCPSKWAISLLNWAYNPFDSIPDVPDEYDEEAQQADSISVGRVSVASLGSLSDIPESNTITQPTLPMDIEYHTIELSGDELTDVESDMDSPVVLDEAELETLAEKAGKADDVEEELAELSEKLDEQDEATELVTRLDDESTEMLADESMDVTVVETETAEMVETVTGIYAEELAQFTPFEADELAARWDPLELKERVEEHDEASLSEQIEDIEQEPEAGNVEGNAGSDPDADGEAELREALAAKLEHDWGWTSQAEKLREGELDPVDVQ